MLRRTVALSGNGAADSVSEALGSVAGDALGVGAAPATEDGDGAVCARPITKPSDPTRASTATAPTITRFRRVRARGNSGSVGCGAGKSANNAAISAAVTASATPGESLHELGDLQASGVERPALRWSFL